MKIALTELREFPGNARHGNVDMIADSLKTLGQYRPIVVNADRTVLAGNHTMLAAKRLGWTEIEAHQVNVDEQTARKINLADNRSNDIATYDDDALLDLLSELDDLIGTGYTDSDIQKLINDTEPPSDPDPSPGLGGDLQYRIVVDCTDEHHQSELLSRFDLEGLSCRPLIS